MARFNESVIALKIARRSVRRNKLQSFLIVAIISVPVFLASALLTFDASTKSTTPEQIKFELGLAQAKYEVQFSPNKNLAQKPDEFFLQEIIPDGTAARNELVDIHQVLPNIELFPISKTEAIFKTASGLGPVSVNLGKIWNPALLNHGPVSLVSGVVPQNDHEVLVTPSALKRFGIELGDTISTENGLNFKVVGTLRDYSESSTADVVFASDQGSLASQRSNTFYYQIGGKSPSWADVRKLNQQGIAVLSRSVLFNPPTPDEQALGSNSGGSGILAVLSLMLFLVPLGLLPVVVLAGSAFAFGARRQTRTLAVMASLGAIQRTLQNVTIASGVWLGLLGGLSGVVIAVLFVAVFGPYIVTQSFAVEPAWIQYPGFHIPWAFLILLVVASSLLGAISSYLPARKASRVNILATLRGQRIEGQVRARTGVGALVILILGLAMVFVSSLLLTFAATLPMVSTSDDENRNLLQRFAIYGQLAGGIVTVIGFMVGRGWILRGIRAVMSRLGNRFKFAGRDLLFNRSRYAPVLSSVLVVYFVGSLILSASFGPMQKQAMDSAKDQAFLSGQYNYTFPVTINRDERNPDSYLSALPSKQSAEYTRNLINQTGAFSSVAVITSTPSFLYGNTVNSYDGQGNFVEAFNVTLPHVIFNPDVVCSYQPFSSSHENYVKEHQDQQSTEDMYDDPPGCVNAMDLNRTIVVGDEKTLAVISDRNDTEAEKVLNNGGIVVFSRLYDFKGIAKIRWTKELDYSMENNFDTSKSVRSEDLPSYLMPNIASSNLRFGAIISPETAAKLGIEAYPMAVLANTESPISAEVSDKLMGRGIWFERYATQNPEALAWIITWAAGIFVLLATSIALGLSQIEAAADKRTLAALGAPKSFRARMVASQAFALTITGALFGGGVGIAVGLTLVMSGNISNFALPLPQVLTLLAGVPVLASFAFWVFTPRELNFASRQSLD